MTHRIWLRTGHTGSAEKLARASAVASTYPLHPSQYGTCAYGTWYGTIVVYTVQYSVLPCTYEFLKRKKDCMGEVYVWIND